MARPFKHITMARKAEISIQGSLDDIIKALIEKALAGNADVGMYLVDRVLGRPSQSLKAEITERATLSQDQLDTIKRMLIAPTISIGPPELGMGSTTQINANLTPAQAQSIVELDTEA